MNTNPNRAATFGSPDRPLRRYIVLRKVLEKISNLPEDSRTGGDLLRLKLIRTWGSHLVTALQVRGLLVSYGRRGQDTTLSFGVPDPDDYVILRTETSEHEFPPFQDDNDRLVIHTSLSSISADFRAVVRHHKKWSAEDIGWTADAVDLLKDVIEKTRIRELETVSRRITNRQTMLKELRPNSLYYNLLAQLETCVGHDYSSLLLRCQGLEGILVAETPKSSRIGQSFAFPDAIHDWISAVEDTIRISAGKASNTVSEFCHLIYGPKWGSDILSGLLIPLDTRDQTERLILVLADTCRGFFTSADEVAVRYVIRRTSPIITNSLAFATRLEKTNNALDGVILNSRSQDELLERAREWLQATFGAIEVHVALPSKTKDSAGGDDRDAVPSVVWQPPLLIPQEFVRRMLAGTRPVYYRVADSTDRKKPFEAFFGTPLRFPDSTTGALVCCYATARQPSPFEQILMETASQRIAAFLAIRSLGDQQLAELRRVVELMEAVAGADDNTLLDLLTGRVKSLFNADYCFVSVPDYDATLREAAKTWGGEFCVPPISMTGQPGDGITGHVAATRSIYCTGDTGRDPYYRDVNTESGPAVQIRSEMAGPLVFEGKLLGVIDLMTSRPSAFSEQEKALLQMLLTYSSIAIDHAQRARMRREQELLTNELHSRLLKLTNPDEIYAVLLDTAIAHIKQLHPGHTIYGNLYVKHPGINLLEAKAFVGPKSSVFSPVLYFGEGVVGTVAMTGEAIVIADTSAPPPGVRYAPFIEGIDKGSEIAVSTRLGSQVDAVINLECPVPSLFQLRDLHALQALAHEISLAVRFAQLNESVRADKSREATAQQLRFLLNLSHEVAKSARTTAMALPQIERLLPDHSDAQKMIRQVRSQVDATLALEQRLLESFGKSPSSRETADVIVVLNDALHRSEKSTTLSVNVHIVRSSFEVAASAENVRIIFDNLIGNAIAAMADDGTLTIREHPVSNPNLLVLDITDTGHGIATADHRKIWEPYFSADAAGHRKGYGIGLWLVKEHMTRMNGGISLHASAPGKGTTFRLTFSER